MDDNSILPPISNQIIQFLRPIPSPEEENRFPHSADRQQSDDNNHEHNQNRNQRNRDRDGSDDVNEEEEEFRRRRTRHVLRRRLRDLGLSSGGHDWNLDWAELLLRLEDQSVTFGVQPLELEDSDAGNPDDFVDVTAYDSLLQTLANRGSAGRRGSGAPPASKSVVEALETVEVNETITDLCPVCKEKVFNDEMKIVKQLPCGHLYHGVCITPWLNLRNTCPVCRHELATDDPEYEEGRLQRSMARVDHGTGV